MSTIQNKAHQSRPRRVKLDRGILAALSAAVLFGLSTPIAKRLVSEMPPLCWQESSTQAQASASASCWQCARLVRDERVSSCRVAPM